MLGNSSRCYLAIESLCETGNHLSPLPSGQSSRRAGSQHKVSVQVHHESVCRGGEQRTALGSDTKDVRAGLLDQVLDGVDDLKRDQSSVNQRDRNYYKSFSLHTRFKRLACSNRASSMAASDTLSEDVRDVEGWWGTSAWKASRCHSKTYCQDL